MKSEITVKDWLALANEDIQWAKNTMGDEYLSNKVAFCCQQAIEKFFKAYLIANNWKLEKTHNLMNLYNEVNRIRNFNIDLDILREINAAYFLCRYPDNYRKISQEDAEKFYKFARGIGKVIERTINMERKIENPLGLGD
jgi:HEPN domain-containing protein